MADPLAGKMTVLDMVQDILSAIDGDEVNSIADTVEADQVADDIRSTFYNIVAVNTHLRHEGLFQLESVSDVNKPNYLKIPANVVSFDWIKYNYQTAADPSWIALYEVAPKTFVEQSERMSSLTNVTAVSTFEGPALYIVNDENPTCFTTFDDTYLVFDSWNSDVEHTLQGHKTMCYGELMPSFEKRDGFIPDLPVDYFPLLLSKSKEIAFTNRKGVSNQLIQKDTRDLKVALQQKKGKTLRRTQGVSRFPDYGRRSPK